MLPIIMKRLLQGIIIIFAIAVITFFVVRLIPGDPGRLMAPTAPPDKIEELRIQMGLGEPTSVQFYKYMKNAIRGDFGWSFFLKENVTTLIAKALPKTGLLLLFSIIIGIVVALPLGLLAAYKNNTWIDNLTMTIAVSFQSFPNYWIALMFILFFSVKLGWFPATGYRGIQSAYLPSIVLSLPLIAVFLRTLRSVMIDSIRQEFVKAARARGLPWFKVVRKYALRNSLIPLLTVFGGQLGFLIGMAVVIEFIFGYPGLGLMTLNAILRRDYYLIQGLVVFLSTLFIVINIVIDIAYNYLDPRIRKAQGGL